jgi:hypothetical protein
MHNGPIERPRTVTVISGILLIYAALGVWVAFGGVLGKVSGGDDSIVKGYAEAAPLFFAVSGGFMLRGANWARFLLFFLCAPAILVVMIAQGGLAQVLFIILPLLVAPWLMLKDSNRYFLGRNTFTKPPAEAELLKSRGSERSGRYDY